ncbi:hypothetical protein HPB51_001855 [Rhipicephalus microplus]|uniref:Uncharacterized protein n=1 Tax=Rhipicephalus microplus TaxID=6941 RepID=A0A9J6D878_RHIMP|nr:hypothetical protein HPB51_001855 [Rhipicephalus microplus]
MSFALFLSSEPHARKRQRTDHLARPNGRVFWTRPDRAAVDDSARWWGWRAGEATAPTLGGDTSSSRDSFKKWRLQLASSDTERGGWRLSGPSPKLITGVDAALTDELSPASIIDSAFSRQTELLRCLCWGRWRAVLASCLVSPRPSLSRVCMNPYMHPALSSLRPG